MKIIISNNNNNYNSSSQCNTFYSPSSDLVLIMLRLDTERSPMDLAFTTIMYMWNVFQIVFNFGVGDIRAVQWYHHRVLQTSVQDWLSSCQHPTHGCLCSCSNILSEHIWLELQRDREMSRWSASKKGDFSCYWLLVVTVWLPIASYNKFIKKN